MDRRRPLMHRCLALLFLCALLSCLGHPALSAEEKKSPEDKKMKDGLYAKIVTNRGDILLKLHHRQTPLTVINFVGLAEGSLHLGGADRPAGTPFYNGLTFHRVIGGFMIQGGCPLGTGTGGPGYTFKDEIHPELVFDKPYLLAMANAGPGTNGSQFFITVVPTPHLNRRHTIFGEVTDEASRKVVDEIAQVRTGYGDKPVEPVVIESVTVA